MRPGCPQASSRGPFGSSPSGLLPLQAAVLASVQPPTARQEASLSHSLPRLHPLASPGFSLKSNLAKLRSHLVIFLGTQWHSFNLIDYIVRIYLFLLKTLMLFNTLYSSDWFALQEMGPYLCLPSQSFLSVNR